MSLLTLSNQIQNVDHHLKSEVGKAVNKYLTMRNWMIGYYIVEYEQEGEERAAYGARLIDTLAETIDQPGLSARNLQQFKQFYLTYPHIGSAVCRQLEKVILQTPSAQLENGAEKILQTPSAQLENGTEKILQTPSAQLKNEDKKILQTPSAQLEKGAEKILQTPSAQLQIPDYERINKLIIRDNPYPEIQTPGEKLLHHISFSKFVELMRIQNPLKRTFYEIECIKGHWSVKELQRQIHSLFYERIGMSKDPEKLKEMVDGKSEKQTPKDIIKNIYTFEFLGFPIKEAVEEQDLEQALLDHLQEFILELGRGFCFEARQKRILIGDEDFFVDLVFVRSVYSRKSSRDVQRSRATLLVA